MTMRHLHRTLSLDIILASMVALGSLGCWVYSYAALLKRSEAAANIAPEISIGERSFRFYQDRSCFGWLDGKLQKEAEILRISASGRLKAGYNGGSITADLSFNAEFNDLGQLGSSFLSVSSESANIRAGTINVNPITVRLKIIKANGEQQFEHQLRGPLELREVDRGLYRFSYAYLDSLAQTKPSSALRNLAQMLNLDVIAGPRGADPCVLTQSNGIDLSMLMRILPGIPQQVLEAVETLK